jgi:hypothetical protein
MSYLRHSAGWTDDAEHTCDWCECTYRDDECRWVRCGFDWYCDRCAPKVFAADLVALFADMEPLVSRATSIAMLMAEGATEASARRIAAEAERDLNIAVAQGRLWKQMFKAIGL